MGEDRRTGWFAAYDVSAVRDFFDLCDRTLEANAASARELERRSGGISGESIEQQVEGARARMRQAATGDWEPFEAHLRSLGRRYADTGLDFPAWHAIANRFYATVVPPITEALSAEPARLAATLLVLGEYQARAMAIIAGEYIATKEERRQEADARHAQLVDLSLDPVVAMDQDGVVTEFNPAAERTFGYAREVAIGTPLGDLIIPPAAREAHKTGLERVIATGENRALGRRMELTGMRADGAEIPIEIAIMQRDHLDGRTSFVGFLRDISERKRAEESSALWTHALDQALFGVVISEVETNHVTWVNTAYARLLGYGPDELIGIDATTLLSPRTNVSYIQNQRGNGSPTLVFELRRKDGTLVPVLISTSIVRSGAGKQVRVSTVLDNTELAQSTSRLEILSRTAHDLAAAEGDLTTLIELVARRLAESIGEACAVRMIGEDPDTTDHRGAFYHVDPEVRAAARSALSGGPHPLGAGIAREVVATGNPVMVPVIDPVAAAAQAPETFRPMLAALQIRSVLAVPIKARGKTLGVASILRSQPDHPFTLDDQRFAQDLADRAGLAIENGVLLATLEERVHQRTRALESANRELESFSYSVSHDLRAPLRAIDSFSALLADDHAAQLDEDGRHLLDRVRANAQRMANLIEGLLALSGVTRATIVRERIDLSALGAEILGELQRMDPERRVTVRVKAGISVNADTRMVRILLENLLGNAWKFTAKRESAEIDLGGDATTFFIRDNGAGFDMRYADELFRPFHRLHSAKEFTGTGVGLATVHRVVRHHGGSIRAESAPDQGATFYVTLVATD